MYENKSLQLAVLISIFLHFTIFLSAPYMGVLHEKQPLNPIKVAYFKIEEHPEIDWALIFKKAAINSNTVKAHISLMRNLHLLRCSFILSRMRNLWDLVFMQHWI